MEREERKLNFLLTISFVSSLATRLMLEDVEGRMPLKDDFRQQVKFALGKIIKNTGESKNLYDTVIHPFIVKEFFNNETKAFEPEKYDDNMADANECCRLLLLYWDKCFNNLDNVNAVFKFLRELPSAEIFDESDIEHYKLR